MSTFDSTSDSLETLLESVVEGKIQLPDFQRGWVWDEEHIRSLLISVARSFPIGSVMLLETGGEARFQLRPVEGVEKSQVGDAENLILDGQQRLTSLTRVIQMDEPVPTRDHKKRKVQRHFYIDIEKAMQGPAHYEEAFFAVDQTKQVKTNFGRDVVLDLSTPELEYEHFMFPCFQSINSDKWEDGLNEHYPPEKFSRYMAFRKQVLNPFRSYKIPVIRLKKETSKEAVCLVFEKVNTGGVSLSVFELVTATYAADNFNLRDDWQNRKKQNFAKRHLLKDLESTDFLQGISLLHSHSRRQADLLAGKQSKEATAITAKREHVLAMPLQAYKDWRDNLTKGFNEAHEFLKHLGFYNAKFLPYRSQVIPLACVLAHYGDRWLEPMIQEKLTRWFWCGVLGELYGGAVESRIALDFPELMKWIEDPQAELPTTVKAAGFQESRLETLRTRNSAAYRGLYILLQQKDSEDFFWKKRMMDLDRSDKKIDIHHIFPKAWCDQKGIQPKVYNSIINKTAISARANRMIGGSAPSAYLKQIQDHASVQLDEPGMNDILQTHLIDPALLRADDFHAFYAARKVALLTLVEQAMGKNVMPGAEEGQEDSELEEEDDVS